MSTIHHITPDILHDFMKKDEALIIDIRDTAEYLDGHIDGSISIPLHELTADAAEYVLSDGKKMIVLCAMGVRSLKACDKLVEEDFGEDIYHLDGGLTAWQDAGFDLINV